MDQHDLFNRIHVQPPLPALFTSTPPETVFTVPTESNTIRYKSDRPALMVSSTSWTADEDFTPLLNALETYSHSQKSDHLPKLLVLVTGKGALQAQFEKEVEKRKWENICVRCLFLPAADYPLLLGSADLGVSMHSSSSGRDLPMKVVDMFGCGVPVLARGFEAIGELVKSGENGEIWQSGEELGELIIVCHRFAHVEPPPD